MSDSDNFTLLTLPVDVLVTILKNLHLSDLRNAMLTCKTMRDLVISDNSIWRSISRDKLILENSFDYSQSMTYSWYDKCRISNNWRKGYYRDKVAIYHLGNYMPWLKYHNSQALLLSVGSELRCYAANRTGTIYYQNITWTLDVPTVLRYDIRTNDISRFIIKGDLLVCGNRDGCVAVYEVGHIRQKPFLLSHIKDCHEKGQVEVTAVELINNRHKSCVVTASESSTQLCLWDMPERHVKSRPSTHSQYPNLENMRCVTLFDIVGIRCLALNGMEDKLAMGPNGNNRPLLLDVSTGQLLMDARSTSNVKQAVRDIQWHNENTVIFVTHSGMLRMIDIRSGALVYEAMDPFLSTLYCVKSDGCHAIVVGSSQYSRCVLFDSRYSSHHVQMYFTHKKASPVYSLDFNLQKLYAAADRSVATLDFNINATSVPLRDFSQSFELVFRADL